LSSFHCHRIGERALKAAKVIELVLPELEVYRERGQRRLPARIYGIKCSSCMWGYRITFEKLSKRLKNDLRIDRKYMAKNG